MWLRHDKTLITGKPGVGKTTLIENIVARMRSVNMVGFSRAKFGQGVSPGLEPSWMARVNSAHVDIDSRHRDNTGGYDGFEVLDIDLLNPDAELQIDEIGKMELVQTAFAPWCARFESDKQLLLRIALKGKDLLGNRKDQTSACSKRPRAREVAGRNSGRMGTLGAECLGESRGL
jgi:hypothetical protein